MSRGTGRLRFAAMTMADLHDDDLLIERGPGASSVGDLSDTELPGALAVGLPTIDSNALGGLGCWEIPASTTAPGTAGELV